MFSDRVYEGLSKSGYPIPCVQRDTLRNFIRGSQLRPRLRALADRSRQTYEPTCQTLVSLDPRRKPPPPSSFRRALAFSALKVSQS